MRFMLSDVSAIRRQYRGARRLGELALALLETPWVIPDATFSLRDPVPFLADVREQLAATLERALSGRAPGRRRVA